MNDLLRSYRGTLRLVRRAHRRTEVDSDRSTLSGMIRDLLWAIEYMETGIEPAYSAGRYKRELPVEPETLEFLLEEKGRMIDQGIPERTAEIGAVNTLLEDLTEQEREAYLLIHVEGFSQRETASLLKVSRAWVRLLVKSASEKIATAHPDAYR